MPTIFVEPTVVERVTKLGDAVIVKSRTLRASNVWIRPSVATFSPLVAKRSVRSGTIRTRTSGLVGVTNGSPRFGRSNGVLRLTHGSQRYRLAIPFAFANIQFEPPREVLRRAA